MKLKTFFNALDYLF